MRCGLPDFEWLTGGGAPAELVHGGVEAHADRRTEDRPHPEDHERQALLTPQTPQELLRLELPRRIATLRLEVFGRTVFADDAVGHAVDAGGGREQQADTE